MKMMKKACFMRLDTAGVFIGWLGMVYSLLFAILTLAMLQFQDFIVNHISKLINLKDAEIHDTIQIILVTICCFYFAIAVIAFVSSVMLILGTILKRHLMLLPWLINTGFNMIILALYIISCIFAMVTSEYPENYQSLFLIFIIILANESYFFHKVYSLFKQLQLKNKNQHQEKPLLISK